MEWILILLVLILIILVSNVKIVPQAYAYIIERFGGYSATWKVGMHVKIPFIEKIA